MPITEAEMSYEDMNQAVKKGYLCAKCQSALTIAWGGSFGIDSYILRCSNNINHNGITRHDKKDEQKRKEYISMNSTALMTMDETKMIQRVEMARFPQELTKEEKRLLAQVAITYGFDPLMGEVTIYQGKPFVSIDGRYRKAQETERLNGVETRPASKQERLDWQIPEDDYFFRSEVYVKDTSRPFVAWGRVHSAELKINKPGDVYKPVVKNPQRMAEKRAEAQALRKAFHIPLPSIEDIGSPEYDVDSTAIDVDRTTGEITESKVRKSRIKTTIADEPEGEKPQEASPEATKSTTSPIKEEVEVIPKTTKELLDWVAKKMKWSDAKTARTWVVNKCKIQESRLTEDVEGCFYEIKELQMW